MMLRGQHNVCLGHISGSETRTPGKSKAKDEMGIVALKGDNIWWTSWSLGHRLQRPSRLYSQSHGDPIRVAEPVLMLRRR
jgi:hypothetical protein